MNRIKSKLILSLSLVLGVIQDPDPIYSFFFWRNVCLTSRINRNVYFALSGHEGAVVAILFGDLGALIALVVAWNKKVLCGAVWHSGQLNLAGLWHQQKLEGLNNLWIIHVNHFLDYITDEIYKYLSIWIEKKFKAH